MQRWSEAVQGAVSERCEGERGCVRVREGVRVCEAVCGCVRQCAGANHDEQPLHILLEYCAEDAPRKGGRSLALLNHEGHRTRRRHRRCPATGLATRLATRLGTGLGTGVGLCCL